MSDSDGMIFEPLENEPTTTIRADDGEHIVQSSPYVPINGIDVWDPISTDQSKRAQEYLRKPTNSGSVSAPFWNDAHVLKTRRLNPMPRDLSLVADVPLKITDFLYDRGAPGIRAHICAGNQADNESLARLLINEDNRRIFVALLRAESSSIAARIFAKLAAKDRMGIISVGTVWYSPSQLRSLVRSELAFQRYNLTAAQIDAYSLLIGEIILRAFAPARIISSEVPGIKLEVRMERFPDADILLEGIMAHEVQKIIEGISISTADAVKAKRFHNEILVPMFDRELQRLCVKLDALSPIPTHFNIALDFVRMLLTRDPILDDYPAAFRTDSNLQLLAQNYNIVKAALSRRGIAVVPKDHMFTIPTIFGQIQSALDAGPRFERQPISRITGQFNHSVVKDPLGKPLHAVVYGNYEYSGDMMVLQFLERFDTGDQKMSYPIDHPDTESTLKQAMANVKGQLSSESIADFLITALNTSDLLQDVEDVGVTQLLMTDQELELYALALSSYVRLAVTADQDTGHPVYHFVYYATRPEINYRPQSGIAPEVLITDPAEIVFISEPAPTTVPIEKRNQLIPKTFATDYYFLGEYEGFFSCLDSMVRIKQFPIGDISYSVRIPLKDLLDVRTSGPLYVMVESTDQALWTAKFAAYDYVLGLFDAAGLKRDSGYLNYDATRSSTSVATHILDFFRELSVSPIIQEMSRTVLMNLRLRHALDDNAQPVTAFRDRYTRLEMSMSMGLVVACRLGYVPWSTASKILSFILSEKAIVAQMAAMLK